MLVYIMKIFLIATCFFLSIISLLLGVEQLSWFILFTSRLPRLIAILLAGIGLAITGVVLQNITQNKFVEPATSGGLDAAKLGILLSITLTPNLSIFPKMVFALACVFVSSIILVFIINQLSFRSSALVPVIGLIFGGFISAIAEFYAYQQQIMQNMQSWLLGDLASIVAGHYELIYIIVPIIALTYFYAYRLTAIGMGRDLSKSIGVNYSITVIIGLLLVSLSVATIVITVGAIPFVGLVIPNLIARRYGDHLSKTLPITAIAGATLLLVCDVLGRVLIFPYEIPIALTAGSIGGLIFLSMILFKRGIK